MTKIRGCLTSLYSRFQSPNTPTSSPLGCWYCTWALGKALLTLRGLEAEYMQRAWQIVSARVVTAK